jgi:hypothetical protein
MDTQESKDGWSDPAGSAKYQTSSAALRLLARIIVRKLAKSRRNEYARAYKKGEDDSLASGDGA